LTIRQLAQSSGVSEATISKIENLHSTGQDVQVIKRLSVALSQPIWFIGCYDLLPDDTHSSIMRKVRLFRGQYVCEFAADLDIDPTALSRHENCKSSPPDHVMEKIRTLAASLLNI